MSYRAGLQAVISRFRKRFPEPDFRYVIALRDAIDAAPHIFTSASSCNFGGDYQEITLYQSDKKIVQIYGSTFFGIRLLIKSPFLKKNLLVYRRPVNLIEQTQYNRRYWLANKPKFAKLGASLASQIHQAFLACSTCGEKKKERDNLCFYCYEISSSVSNMVYEGGING